MNPRTFTILVLMVGATLLALLVAGGARFVAAQAEPAAPSVLALPVLSAGEMSEVERQVQVPTVAVTPGNLGSVTPPAAIAAEAENVELVGHIGGVAYAVFVQGHYAYVGEGLALVILDISDPASPAVLGRTAPLPDIVEDIYVSGDYAYIADGDGGDLQVVDVSNPALPAEIGSCPFNQGSASGVAMAGGYAYLANGYDGLWVVDMSDPNSPQPCGHNGTLGYARDVVVAGNYAYVADANMGLRVVNIVTPCNPEEAGSVGTPGAPHGIAVSGTLVYVADDYRGLRVVDVRDAKHPQEVGSYDTPGIAYGVAVAGGYAYVADWGSGLRVVDVSRPISPTEVGFCYTPGYARGVAVADGYAYVADRDSLQVVDTSIPKTPVKAGSYDAPGSVNHVAVAGSYAYIVGNYRCLNVVGISTPAMPSEVGSCKTSGSNTGGVAVEGSYAYLADGQLRVVYIYDPAAPQDFVRYLTLGSAYGVAVLGTYVYVADSAGLEIVDVTHPTDPSRFGRCPLPASAYNVMVVWPYAYIADSSSGLCVVDVSHSNNPTLVDCCDTPGTAYDVAVAGNYAYVADGYAGLQVVDVSNPADLTGVGYYDTPGEAMGVAIAGDYAYVADGSGGLWVVDVSVPNDPTQVGFYDTRRQAHDVTVAGNYAYVAALDNGLFVLYFAGVGSEPPSTVTISGPTTGFVGVAQTFTAIVNPISATRPITYVWKASEQQSLTHVGGRSDTVSFTWRTTGTKTVTVTATNARGSTVDTHTITIGTLQCVPVQRVMISGSTTGTAGTPYTFTAMVSPLTATQPITYVLQATGQSPVTHRDGLSVTFGSMIWNTPGSKVITVTASNACGSAGASHTIAISEPGDAYEPDDACIQAQSILTNGTVQVHTFHDNADADWVTFNAISGTTYLIEVHVPADSPADVALGVYGACGGPLQDGQDHDFSPGVRLEFKAPTDGPLYLVLSNHDPSVYGPEAAYHLSVRALADAPTPGAVVIVAGKRRDGDPLQPNIHNVTNAVYRLFLAYGYDDSHIHYLATDLTLDPDDDKASDVDGLPTPANVEQAIREWAADKVGLGRPLTLYLTDHGNYDLFYLNGSTQTVSPDDVDRWLEALEESVPGVQVNVIVEACHAGSFIDSASTSVLIQTLSKPGRVVITSTGARGLAYASEGGAVFSDSFVRALGSCMSLYSSFQEARWAVQQAHLDQTPWLDDDGDGRPNEREDGQEAARRGFGCGRAMRDTWPPYVVWASIKQGVIEAEVRDDVGVSRVWAVVYPPSYQPPDPATTEEWVQEGLAEVPMLDPDGDGVYRVVYAGFGEVGVYRVVVHAADEEGLVARPKSTELHRIYLPLITLAEMSGY